MKGSLLLVLFLCSNWLTQLEWTEEKTGLEFFARGTGHTTGHIATLDIYNPSQEFIKTEFGPFFIPGTGDYQGYVINQKYALEIEPFGFTSIEVEGYCTNIFDPAVPEGEYLINYKKWISPHSSMPIPGPEWQQNKSKGFAPVSAPAVDSMVLTFAGTSNAFLYKIGLDEHPNSAANMLIHAINELERSYDELVIKQKIGPRSYIRNSKDQRLAIVQQAFWHYTSLLEGTGYNPEYFKTQFTEQTEQLINKPSSIFTERTKKVIATKTDQLWSVIKLVGSHAKLMAPYQQQPESLSNTWEASLLSQIKKINPATPDALKEWMALKDTLTIAGGLLEADIQSKLDDLMNQLFISIIDQTLKRLDVNSSRTGQQLFALLDLLEANQFYKLDKNLHNEVNAKIQSKLQDWFIQEIGAFDQEESKTLDEIYRYLYWFNDVSFVASLEEKKVQHCVDQLKKSFQNIVLREAMRIDPEDQEAGKKILRLIDILRINFFVADLGLRVSDDMVSQLYEKWKIWLASEVESIDPKDDQALENIIAKLLLLKTTWVTYLLDFRNLDALNQQLSQKLGENLIFTINAIDPKRQNAKADLVANLSFLHNYASRYLAPDLVTNITNRITGKLNKHFKYQAESLDTEEIVFLKNWRTNQLLKEFWWYDQYVSIDTKSIIEARQEMKLDRWLGQQEGHVHQNDIQFSKVGLIGDQWKITFPGVATAVPVEKVSKPFPIWVTAIPIVGAGAYLLINESNKSPSLLAPINDELSISCSEMGVINVLANDFGEEIDLMSFSTSPEATIIHTGNGNFEITSIAGNSFSFTYTITNNSGSIKEGRVFVEVIQPNLSTVNDQFTMMAGEMLSGNLLGNDNGENVFVSEYTQPEEGTVMVSPSGDFTLIANEGYCGSMDFTYKVTDACQQVVEGLVEISTKDKTSPIIECPTDMTIDCGQSIDPSQKGQPTASDNCDSNPNLNFSDEISAGICPNEQLITRTWTITDNAGNTASCVQMISVQDTVQPILTHPADLTLECGQSTDPSSTGQATATDNCNSNAEIEITYEDQNEFSGCEGGGTIVRTWVATDACGNSVSSIQHITLQDGAGPALTCPVPVTVDCQESVDPSQIGMATVSDNCDADPVLDHFDNIEPGNCPNERIVSRTWRAVDGCGNESTCVQTIIIGDLIAPVISVPPPAEISCIGDPDPTVTGTATATDNCSNPSLVEIDFIDDFQTDCSGEWKVTRTWSATDLCGNMSSASQIITLVGYNGPEVECPADVSIDCSTEPAPFLTGTAVSIDNCAGNLGEIQLNYNDQVNQDGSGNLTIMRTWMVFDPCNNFNECVQTILITDTTAPIIECPADVTISCTDINDPVETGHPVVSDLCTEADDIQIEYTDDESNLNGCGNTGEIKRIWTVTDATGNSSTCIQLIIIQDEDPPTLTCPSNVVLNLGESTDPVHTGEATANDNCTTADDLTLTFTDDENSLNACSGTGSISRTWLVSDICGNTSNCIQEINIQDITPPSLDCPADISLHCGQQPDLVLTGQPNITDNSGAIASVNYTDDATGLNGCDGVIIRTWIVVDSCGNSSICEQNIFITSSSCSFSPTFGINPTDCNESNGSISTIISPDGNYDLTWDTGDTGSELSNIAAGTYEVSITDIEESCTEVYQVVVGNNTPYSLSLQSFIHPSSQIASDGSITLEVSGFPVFPLQVFINGNFFTEIGLPVFTLENLPTGTFSIQVIDNSLNACLSNAVVVTLEATMMRSWSLEVLPAVIQNFLPDATSLHQRNSDSKGVNDILKEWGFEDPMQEEPFAYYYQPTSISNFNLLFLPNKQMEIRLGFFQSKGTGVINQDLEKPYGGISTMNVRSDFQALFSEFGWRYIPGTGRLQSFFGINILWNQLTTANSLVTVNNQQAIVQDGYRDNEWRAYLSGGGRLRIGNSSFFDLDFRLMEGINNTTGKSQLFFTPRLGVRLQW